MPADGFDAVVVGAGPNGLVAALVLASSGRKVLVLEAASRIGGALRTEELTLPGFQHDVGAAVLPLALVSPAFRALRLEDDSEAPLSWAHPPIPVGHPVDGGAAFAYRDLDRTAEGLGPDGAAWRRLIGVPAAAGDRLSDALLSPLSARAAGAGALPLLRYGATGVLPATTLANSAFRTEPARALFAGMAGHSVLRLQQPASAGYGIFLAALAHRVGWPMVRGGSERLAEALGRRLSRLGGEIQVDTRVDTLADVPAADITVLDLTPRQVAAVAGTELPPRYLRRLARFRYGPGVFKMDWALAGPVPWRDERLAQAGTVHIGGTLAEITASEAAVAAGHHAEHPYVLCVQPTAADPSRAPAGRHILWAYCHVPHGSDVDQRHAIEAQLERFAPGFKERVLARHVLFPRDLEAIDANLVGGDVGGGAADVRQFVARPVLAVHPWATPRSGLYLCSASTPPGGGVHGMGGWHAAHLAMRRTGVVRRPR